MLILRTRMGERIEDNFNHYSVSMEGRKDHNSVLLFCL